MWVGKVRLSRSIGICVLFFRTVSCTTSCTFCSLGIFVMQVMYFSILKLPPLQTTIPTTFRPGIPLCISHINLQSSLTQAPKRPRRTTSTWSICPPISYSKLTLHAASIDQYFHIRGLGDLSFLLDFYDLFLKPCFEFWIKTFFLFFLESCFLVLFL